MNRQASRASTALVAAPLAAAALAAALGSLLLVRAGPFPAAQMRRGGEEAFASGLYPRELIAGGAPLRWTKPRARVVFESLPDAPLTLEVSLPGRRGAALVSDGGRILGQLGPGQRTAAFELPPGPARREIGLVCEPFLAGDGRTLGAQLERVTLHWPRSAWPRLGLAALLALAGLGVGAGAARAAGRPGVAALAAVLGVLALLGLLWPLGLAFSPSAPGLALAVAATGAAAGELGRRLAGSSGADALALAAGAFVAALVLGVAAAWPGMVVSDAVFQANKLTQVAAGDWFPVSVTQHQPPFRFPYGVAFFGLLVPLAEAGFEPVSLVRAGASLAMAAAAFAWTAALAPAGARRAALAVGLLVALPIHFDVFSYGNLANAFAQAATLALLGWWIGPARGGVATGALLATLAGLSHLSGALVLVPLALALVLFADADGVRRRALAVGVGTSVAYYATFTPMAVAQLGRLGEGGGRGGAEAGLWAGLLGQLGAVVGQWGLPVLALAAFSGWRRGEDTREGGVVRASLAAGALLAAVAVLSPLQPRYLYALGAIAALQAAGGALALARRGRAGALAAIALLALALLRGGSNAVEALLWRYRP